MTANALTAADTLRPAHAWGVVANGRLVAAYADHAEATARARSERGMVASIEGSTRHLGVRVGDRVAVDNGLVGPV